MANTSPTIKSLARNTTPGGRPAKTRKVTRPPPDSGGCEGSPEDKPPNTIAAAAPYRQKNTGPAHHASLEAINAQAPMPVEAKAIFVAQGPRDAQPRLAPKPAELASAKQAHHLLPAPPKDQPATQTGASFTENRKVKNRAGVPRPEATGLTHT